MTYTVRNDVRVTLQGSLGVAILRLVAGEVPDDEGLVSARGEEHVGAGESKRLDSNAARGYRINLFSNVLLHGGSQAGNPAILNIIWLA